MANKSHNVPPKSTGAILIATSDIHVAFGLYASALRSNCMNDATKSRFFGMPQ
jgi:hypothetical protein